MQRQIARERTEFVQRKALEQVDANPTPANIRAAVETLRRAASLDGLDAALRVAVDPSDHDMREFVATMIAMGAGQMPQEADIFADEYNSPTPIEQSADDADLADTEPVGDEWYARRDDVNDAHTP